MENQQSTNEAGMGHNSDPVGKQRLTSFIERIERLEEEKASLIEDIKEIYSEAKGVGYDAKIIRKVVARRKMSSDKREEQDSLLDLYEGTIQGLNEMME